MAQRVSQKPTDCNEVEYSWRYAGVNSASPANRISTATPSVRNWVAMTALESRQAHGMYRISTHAHVVFTSATASIWPTAV